MPTNQMSKRVPTIVAWVLFLASLAHAQSPWTLRNQRTGGDDLWGITSGPGGLVAVGTNGAILQSTDGQSWIHRVSGTTDWLTAVTYGNGHYVAVGEHGRILSSADSTTWTPVAQSVTTQRLNNVLFGVTAGQNTFVAVGEAGTILYSPDGITWTGANSGSTSWLRGLALGFASEGPGSINRIPFWIASGQGGTALISLDTVHWKTINSGTTADLECAAFLSGTHAHVAAGPGGGNVFFFVGGQGGVARMLNINFSDIGFFDTASSTSTAISLGTTARIRMATSGAHTATTYLSIATVGGSEHAEPAVAIDESGSVFSNYGMEGVWPREALPLPTALRAGIYFAPQESFYAVGENESVFQRDQVFNGRLGNISTRGFVDQAEKALIAGFVVHGVTPKSVLVRGVGPTLADFGVTGALPRPVLTVFDAAGKVVATNSGWDTNADPSAVAAAAARAGAFTLDPGSNDSALLLTLPPGLYSAQVAGAAGTSGVALAEVYDLDAQVNGTARAINLSTRGVVASGENILIAGLSVQGPAWRTFLVRGIGPSLSKFGVANPVADPVLKLTSISNAYDPRSYTITYVNRAAATITADTKAVGAFPTDPGSKDDALVATLPPGNYTFQVASSSGATGVALVEIYEVPFAP